MANLKRETVGNIVFKEGTLSATDPCYDRSVAWRIDSIPIVPGEYECSVMRECDRDGNVSYMQRKRVKSLRIQLNDQETADKIDANKSWRSIGVIGTDTGMAGFFQNKPDVVGKKWFKMHDALGKAGAFINGYAFYKDETKNANGIVGVALKGDGEYEVFVIRNKQHRVTALEIRF